MIIDNNSGDTVEVKHWKYRYDLGPVRENWPLYVSVTAYDNGYPPAKLNSLESSVFSNMIFLRPYTPVSSERNKEVVVVPNPYKMSMDYSGIGWEPLPAKWTEFDRRIDFTHLPGNALIKIFTIAGDLVAEVRNSDGDTRESWNVLSQNEQAVVSGIYLFTVEPDNGGEIIVGKFVIIK